VFENDQNELELDLCWNDLVRGAGDGRPPASPDEELVVVLDRLARTAQPEDSRNRVIGAIQREIAQLDRPVSRNGHVALVAEPLARPQAPRSIGVERAVRRPRSIVSNMLSHAAVAALMLATGLGVGYLAFHATQDQSALVSSTAEPSGRSDWETLVDVSLPAGAIAPGPHAATLVYTTVVPGLEASTLTAGGVQVTYVLAGELTVVPSSDAQVQRASSPGKWSAASAREEIVLAPGDAVAFLEQQIVLYRNNSDAPLIALSLNLDEAESASADAPPGWQVEDSAHATIDLTGPATGSTRIELRSFEMVAGVNVHLDHAEMPPLIVNATTDSEGNHVSASAAMPVGDEIRISPNFFATVFVAYVSSE
jgi:hypothetical protein